MVDTILNCVDCGVPVGTITNKSIPTRCNPCRIRALRDRS